MSPASTAPSTSVFDSSSILITIEGDPKVLNAVSTAMVPEITHSREPSRRCHLSIETPSGERSSFIMIFESKDLVSLRASLNSNLRLVSSALKTLSIL